MKSIIYKIISLLSLCVFLTLSLPPKLLALEVENLYKVNVEVKQQTRKPSYQTSLKGFREVLIRRSGSIKILATDEAKQAYKKVTSYLQKFEYFRNNESATVNSNETPSENNYVWSLYFEQRLIDDLIKRANQPLWDFNRPVTILWLAQEETNEFSSLERRIIVESDREQIVNNMLLNNSVRRAVPYILPLMDLEDSLVVSKSDVWGRFPESIIDASKRYSTDSVLIGKIYQRGNEWQGQFTYLNQAISASFEHQADNLEAIYSAMFDNLAEVLCEQYCITQTMTDGEQLLVEVENISNFDTFQKLKVYLSELSAIRQVSILNVNKDKALFKLDLLSGKKAVMASLSLNQNLKLVDKENEKLEVQLENEISNLTSSDTTIDSELTQNIGVVLESEASVKIEEQHKTEIETAYYRWVD